MKDTRITVRLSVELQKQVEAACAVTGLDQPTIIRECLKAFVEEVIATGEIRLPVALLSKSEKTSSPRAERAQPARPALRRTEPTEANSLNETSPKPPSRSGPSKPVKYK